LQDHARTRKRLAALAAFGAFWAVLLVTIGIPIVLVGVVYLALVLGVGAAVEGPRALPALAGRAKGVDLTPLRERGDRVAAAVGARASEVRTRVEDARSQRSARSEAHRLNARAAALRQRGALDAALAASEQALELVRGLGDRHAEALTLNGLGLTQARLGDEAGAVDSYETAVAILTELGDGHGAGRVLANLGALQLDLGHADEARARWTDALRRLEPGSREHERTAEQLRLAG
jgi:tetratricopeptide (TPR) repeat protein